MLNLQRLMIESFVEELKRAYFETYSILEPEIGNIIAWVGRLSLENIANTNALYHNVDHTILVTSVGQAILKGKHILEGGVTTRDWLHFIISLLCHDIGFVKGICSQDRQTEFATGLDDEMENFPAGKTDAFLMPFHVDRSKLFVKERFGGKQIVDFNTDVISNYIEMTRFPIPDSDFYKDTSSYGGLVRAADFIGQLGDPNYLRKIPALYYEFVETGQNEKIGYKNPGDMCASYAKFYWNVVNPYIQHALKYLNVTQEGKQWVANLHSHVFEVEHGRYDPEVVHELHQWNSARLQ